MRHGLLGVALLQHFRRQEISTYEVGARARIRDRKQRFQRLYIGANSCLYFVVVRRKSIPATSYIGRYLPSSAGHTASSRCPIAGRFIRGLIFLLQCCLLRYRPHATNLFPLMRLRELEVLKLEYQDVAFLR